MRLFALDGSPRGKRSNTALLLERFLEGVRATGDHQLELAHLASRGGRERALAQLPLVDGFLLGFPLYVDSMPALVKEFVEKVGAERPERIPPLVFLVQSGFPEACHSRPVERWLEKLARRLGAEYRGTIVKGGVEGIRAMSPWTRKQILGGVEDLGRIYARTGRLDPAVLAAFAGPERLSARRILLARLAAALGVGLAKLYFDAQLLANGTRARRDDRPYAA